MTLTSITEKQYSDFLKNYPYKNFLNTPNIGHFKVSEGNKIHYLGLFDDNTLIAACLLTEKKNKFSSQSIWHKMLLTSILLYVKINI